MKRRLILPSILLTIVVGLGFVEQLSYARQQFPESNRNAAGKTATHTIRVSSK